MPQWYRRISALVAGFDAPGLKPGDHLVTLLQNRWEAATIHWACQFAGIIVTPLNWRSTADELDFCVENAEAKALVYEAVSAEAVKTSPEAGRHAGASRSGVPAGESPSRRCWRRPRRDACRGPTPKPGR